jgi:hypothetical protein
MNEEESDRYINEYLKKGKANKTVEAFLWLGVIITVILMLLNL